MAAYRRAIRLKPDYREAYYSLGNTLQQQKKSDEAKAAFHNAIEFQTDCEEANSLGVRLYDEQRRIEEAAAAFRQAIRLNPQYARGYSSLGHVYYVKNQLDEARIAYRKAIELHTEFRELLEFGKVLSGRGMADEAVAAFGKAIQLLTPKHAVSIWKGYTAEAYYCLGNVLYGQWKLKEAKAAFREAIQLRARYKEAYFSLGNVLRAQQKFDEAESAYRNVIALAPKDAEAHIMLGVVLRRMVQFNEAIATLRKGHDLLPALDPRRQGLKQELQELERFPALDARLPAVLKGSEKPSTATERIWFGELCYHKQLYAASVNFYRSAFPAEPGHTEAVSSRDRYNAACSAALAGCGQGKDAGETKDEQRHDWRKCAHDWLRADLEYWGKALDEASVSRAEVEQRLRHRLRDPDLAGVRNNDALAKLPDPERKQWEKLWADLAALLRRTSSNR